MAADAALDQMDATVRSFDDMSQGNLSLNRTAYLDELRDAIDLLFTQLTVHIPKEVDKLTVANDQLRRVRDSFPPSRFLPLLLLPPPLPVPFLSPCNSLLHLFATAERGGVEEAHGHVWECGAEHARAAGAVHH